jgi:hypothetical protein
MRDILLSHHTPPVSTNVLAVHMGTQRGGAYALFNIDSHRHDVNHDCAAKKHLGPHPDPADCRVRYLASFFPSFLPLRFAQLSNYRFTYPIFTLF